MKTLLIIGHTFPEPSTTAAGIRMMQLIDLFLEEGYSLTFASTAIPSERSANLDAFGIRTVGIHLNDPSFDTFIRQLNPSMVLFDRYLTEEQFGWRVAEGCPHSLRILDTEDLHFLRKAREIAFNNKLPVQQADLYTDTAKRELASMLRCDLSLIISEAEMELLQNTFSIPATLLHYLPLFVEVASEAIVHTLPDFHSRSGFMTVGNLLHAPNVASVRMLKTSLWPEIRKRLPAATLYVYGAYASQEISSFH
ncbi:MAG: glycosyltransferase, partial [Altibacter sp.]|nr:glycosyltransferase [Altibacter sp.]